MTTIKNAVLNEALVVEFGAKYIKSKKDAINYSVKYFDKFKDGELDFIVASIFYATDIFNQITESLADYPIRTTAGKFNAMVDEIVEKMRTITTEIISANTIKVIVESKLKEINTPKEKSLYFVLAEALEEGYKSVRFLGLRKYQDIESIELDEGQQLMKKFEIDIQHGIITLMLDNSTKTIIADLKK